MHTALRSAYHFHRQHSACRIGYHARDALAYARAECLLKDARDANLARIEWQDDEDFDPDGLDRQDITHMQSGEMIVLGCTLSMLGQVEASLWGIMLSRSGDPYMRTIEAELALECREQLIQALASQVTVEGICAQGHHISTSITCPHCQAA